MHSMLIRTGLSLTFVCVSFGVLQQAWAMDVDTHIRTLASSCTICHGTQPNQNVIPSLAGLDRDYFVKKMKSYQNSDQPHEVMVQHAKGLSEKEIEQLAILFSEQSRACPYYRNQATKKLLEP